MSEIKIKMAQNLKCTKPKVEKNHEENRSKVCAPCGLKLKSGGRNLTTDHCQIIKDNINPEFDIDDPKFPIGLCGGCRKRLSQIKKGISVKLPSMPNYEECLLPKPTRSQSNPQCFCFICLTARDKRPFRNFNKGGRGKTYVNEVTIDSETGMFGAMFNDTSPDPVIPPKEEQSRLTVCGKCHSEIARGKSHTCTVAASSVHVVDKVLQLPDKQQQQVITGLIKQQQEVQSSSSTSKTLLLSTKGKKVRVSVHPPKERNVFFSEDSLDELQGALENLSNSKMKIVSNWVRCHAGRKAVPPHYRKHLTERSQLAKDIFNVKKVEMDGYKGTKVKRDVVYANATDLIDLVAESRGYSSKIFVKAMADGGRNFLKVCLTILPEDFDPDKETEPKVSLYAEGGTAARHANGKLTGVKKLLMLAIVPDVPETNYNMELLMDLTQLNKISHIFVADFKLLLIMLGKQNAVSAYPCPYCLIPLGMLRNSDPEELDIPSEEIPALTFGHLEKDHQTHMVKFKGDRKKGMFSHSTIASSVLKADENTRVLDKCPLDELHVLSGFVNHTFYKGLVPAVGYEVAMKWPKILNLVAKDYHGEVFEGNACRKLLSSTSTLTELIESGDIPREKAEPYVDLYISMDKLVSTCFHVGKVDENANIPNLLKAVIQNYKSIDNLSVTLKVHVLFHHLVPCLLNLGGQGLGLYSCQSVEGSHREFFEHFWGKNPINSFDNELYADRLFNAVVEFTSKHC